MSYDTKYPSHACVYDSTTSCTNTPSSDNNYINKSLNEMLTEANKCFTPNGTTYNTSNSLNCKNIFYDLSKVALSIKDRNDSSYKNLLDLVNQVNTDLKILRKEDDPSLKAGIEEKTRDLNKSLLMNIMWTTLAVTTLYYVFRKI